MDISTQDCTYQTKMETEYGVKMTEEDKQYKDDQVSGPRMMYCESFADKRWLATVERRRREEERMVRARERDATHQDKLFTKMAVPEDTEEMELEETDVDRDFVDEVNNCEEVATATKKRRISGEKEKMTLSFADMPKDCHLRHSVKQVRAEYYTTADELMSV